MHAGTRSPSQQANQPTNQQTHTHTHTHMYIYSYFSFGRTPFSPQAHVVTYPYMLSFPAEPWSKCQLPMVPKQTSLARILRQVLDYFPSDMPGAGGPKGPAIMCIKTLICVRLSEIMETWSRIWDTSEANTRLSQVYGDHLPGWIRESADAMGNWHQKMRPEEMRYTVCKFGVKMKGALHDASSRAELFAYACRIALQESAHILPQVVPGTWATGPEDEEEEEKYNASGGGAGEGHRLNTSLSGMRKDKSIKRALSSVTNLVSSSTKSVFSSVKKLGQGVLSVMGMPHQEERAPIHGLHLLPLDYCEDDSWTANDRHFFEGSCVRLHVAVSIGKQHRDLRRKVRAAGLDAILAQLPADAHKRDAECFSQDGMEIVIRVRPDGETMDVVSLPLDSITSVSQLNKALKPWHDYCLKSRQLLADFPHLTEQLDHMEDLICVVAYAGQLLQRVFIKQQMTRAGLIVQALPKERTPDDSLLPDYFAALGGANMWQAHKERQHRGSPLGWAITRKLNKIIEANHRRAQGKVHPSDDHPATTSSELKEPHELSSDREDEDAAQTQTQTQTHTDGAAGAPIPLTFSDMRLAGLPIVHLSERVYMCASPKYLLECEAYFQGLLTTIRPHENGTFQGGFTPDQFLRRAPLVPFRLDKPTKPLPYKNYFDSSDPFNEPLEVTSQSERLFLFESLVQRPVNTVPDVRGVVDYFAGGAGIFFRQLKALDVIKDACLIHKLNSNQVLVDTWCMPWQAPDVGYRFFWQPVRWFKQPLDAIAKYYGPQVAEYFHFLGFYCMCLGPAGIIGLVVEVRGVCISKEKEYKKKILRTLFKHTHAHTHTHTHTHTHVDDDIIIKSSLSISFLIRSHFHIFLNPHYHRHPHTIPRSSSCTARTA